MKMFSSLCQGHKDQLIRKYDRKFLVSNISHIEFIIYIKKFTIVNILGYIFYIEIWTTAVPY